MFLSPRSKLVACFLKSRDKWKAKYKHCKHQLKLAQNQSRAVEKSRAQWRERAARLRERVRELEQDLAEQKTAWAAG